MLGDLPGMVQLVAMVGCPRLGLNEPLEGLSQRDLLLLAEDNPFMCLGPDLGCNTFSGPLVRGACGSRKFLDATGCQSSACALEKAGDL